MLLCLLSQEPCQLVPYTLAVYNTKSLADNSEGREMLTKQVWQLLDLVDNNFHMSWVYCFFVSLLPTFLLIPPLSILLLLISFSSSSFSVGCWHAGETNKSWTGVLTRQELVYTHTQWGWVHGDMPVVGYIGMCLELGTWDWGWVHGAVSNFTGMLLLLVYLLLC